MVDLNKSVLKDVDLNRLYNNPNLSFVSSINEKEGEILPKAYVAKYSCFTITLKPPIIRKTIRGKKVMYIDTDRPKFVYGEVKGSIHYFSNNGIHNYNRLTHLKLITAVLDLSQILDIPLEKFWLVNLEIGLNLDIPFSVDEVLNSCILHQKKPIYTGIYHKEAFYKESRHSRDFIKLYDKSKQNKLNSNILRIERKFMFLEFTRKCGIFTLADLVSCDFSIFKPMLLKVLDEITFIHNGDFKDESEKFYQYRDHEFWQKLKAKNHLYHRNEIKKRIKSNPDSLKSFLALAIEKEFDRFYPFPIRSGYLGIVHKWIGRVCPLTGVDISKQRNDSFYLSHAGLKHLHENNPKKYQEIKGRFLSCQYWSLTPQKQIEEIAHKIRRAKQSGYALLRKVSQLQTQLPI